MKFGTYQLGHKTSACAILGSYVYDLAQAFFRHYRRPFKFVDLLAFLQADGPEKLADVELGRMKEDRTVCLPLKEVRLRAPILRPPKIVCVGLNYRDHAMEQKKEPPAAPLLFSKAPNVVIGDGDAIRIPTGISDKVDYEVELGVVIGRTAFRVSKAEALSHVFGYTVFNDVGSRSVQFHNGQRDLGKNFDTFCPMGPCIVTRDELPDWDAVRIRSHVNGELRQDALVGEQIGPPPVAIEWLSSIITLEPGDCLMTGTPAGCGTFMNPPRFLEPGDVVTVSASGIGELTNHVVAGTGRTRRQG